MYTYGIQKKRLQMKFNYVDVVAHQDDARELSTNLRKNQCNEFKMKWSKIYVKEKKILYLFYL